MPISDAVRALERDLRGILGGRLRSLVIYGQRGARASHDAHGGSDAHAGHAAHGRRAGRR
jgi:hypothetical protein